MEDFLTHFEKAKYIKRTPKKSGKGYDYQYQADLQNKKNKEWDIKEHARKKAEMQAEFNKQKAKVDNLINQFVELSRNNFNVQKDDINYQDSEQLKYVAKEMTDLFNFVSGQNK